MCDPLELGIPQRRQGPEEPFEMRQLCVCLKSDYFERPQGPITYKDLSLKELSSAISVPFLGQFHSVRYKATSRFGEYNTTGF